MTSVDSSPLSDEESAATPLDDQPSTELLFGPGQSAWLAAVTLVAVIALIVAFVSLVVASNAEGGGGTAAPIASGPVTELTVNAADFSFAPKTPTIAADTAVAVDLVNIGATEHNWTVLGAGTEISSEDEYEESMAAVQISALAGETGSGTVELSAGSYQVICTIAGHFTSGMSGTLTVAS